ncbi:MAG: TonB family protein [Thermoanaerobaculia bacterium]
MHDAVADVLAERRRLDGTTRFGWIGSLLLHGALASAILLSGRVAEEPLRPVLTVRLRPVAPAQSSPPVTTPKKTAVAAKPAPPPKPVEKPKKQTVHEKAIFGRSPHEYTPPEKKPAPAASQPQPASSASESPAADSGFAVPGIGQAGVTGLEGGDFPYTIYIERMLSLVGSHWFRPSSAQEMLAQVYFVIERDGRIRDAQVEKSSGNPLFDRAALRSVVESSPLPPLPYGYSGNQLGVHLTFH